MKHREERFVSVGGRDLYYQVWEPDAPMRALILLAHGLGEHGGRYAELAQVVTAKGYVLAAIDHYGHGRSGGEMGDIERFAFFLDDFGDFSRRLREAYVGVPVVVIGHSMGGLIAARYLVQHQNEFVAAVLSGPAVELEPEPGVLQRALIGLLATIAPRLGLRTIDPVHVSRDPEVVRRYAEDPLVYHGPVRARQLREFLKAMAVLREEMHTIRLPLLVLHGEADALTAPAGSRLLHERAQSDDKRLQLYPALYHEIFNEPEREQVFEDMLSWCEIRLPR